jgi:GT2 family glycosyltransferase
LHQALPFSPDWIAGMFMLFRSELFREVGGFDERYFLYYEDVDLCFRLRQHGYEVILVPDARAVHFAQRQSHRNLRYLLWHVRSLVRFLLLRGCFSRKGTGGVRFRN